MDYCLLCLEVNKDILDCIRVNSERWQELDVAKIIEKHFWPLIAGQNGCWMCLPCWREVDSFHKFYLRIEESHMNFGKIKLENGETGKNNMAFDFLEQEIAINQVQQRQFEEPEILTNEPTILAKFRQMDEVDIDDVPLHKASKRLRLQNDTSCKDPLGKPKKKNFRKKNSKEEENKTKSSKVLVDSLYLKDNSSDSISDNCNDVLYVTSQTEPNSQQNLQTKTRKPNSKHYPNRKENDKFIAEHFKQMFCVLCQVPFKDFPDMQKHFIEIHNQRGYVVCCNRKFSDRTRLVDHIHCHINPEHFKCKECGKTMSDRIKFDNHMLRVHRANEVVKQHCCDVCGKSFREAYVLRTHKLIHLPEEEKKYHCSECGKNYGSSYLLNQHKQVVHLKRFVKICYICGKEINSNAEFKAHMNKHEGVALPVINCDVCGLRLTSERGLKVHKESQHPVGGKQEHPCPICKKTSPTARALKKHINNMHEKGFDYKCNMCEKVFRRAEALKEHMASHTGTPLYVCPWCPMTFNSNGNMHAHRKNKHPKEYLELKLQKYSIPIISERITKEK